MYPHFKTVFWAKNTSCILHEPCVITLEYRSSCSELPPNTFILDIFLLCIARIYRSVHQWNISVLLDSCQKSTKNVKNSLFVALFTSHIFWCKQHPHIYFFACWIDWCYQFFNFPQTKYDFWSKNWSSRWLSENSRPAAKYSRCALHVNSIC